MTASAAAVEDTRQQDFLAAVDLGSNSFHMVVARNEDGNLVIIDRLREMVRLAEGLRRDGTLDPDVIARALDCLSRFGQRLTALSQGNVRIVGTNTLRKARRSRAFLEQSEAALGHPIEVISGREEARMVYLGVAHSAPREPGNRLVVDIGGGSTELIVGEGMKPLEMSSQYLGCISATRQWFRNRKFTRKRLRKALLAVGVELEPIAPRLKRLGWDSVVGSSGTVRATESVLRANGWCESGISRDGLDKLMAHFVELRHLGDTVINGVAADRMVVFPGGAVILAGVFDALGIEHMRVSDGALREGLLIDLIGRRGGGDARTRSLQALQRRYEVDVEQAESVARTGAALLEGVAGAWELEHPLNAKLVQWAAAVHEIGLAVAHAKYHAHGAYLLRVGDLPGFSQYEQILLASMVACHRRKLSASAFDKLPRPWGNRLRRLIVPFRLAVLLNRSRSYAALPAIALEAGRNAVRLVTPDGWLDDHPLTRADLELEARYLAALDLDLQF
ncbi:MAG: Ppx/GppA phosphatase family protein [Pseudomonadota bacterium]